MPDANHNASDDDDLSLQDYPLDRQRTIINLGAKIILTCADVNDVIFQYCDSGTLF